MILVISKHEVSLLAAFLSLISVQIGAAIAKTIFPILGAESVALMRLGLSAILLWIMFNPYQAVPKDLAVTDDILHQTQAL